MTLTRKDFNIIADELRNARPDHPAEAVGFDRAVRALSGALCEINPRFDADRFYLATCRDDNDLLSTHGDTRCSRN